MDIGAAGPIAGAIVSIPVLLVGLADMVISFLRVENLLPAVVGTDLAEQLGRSRFRGPYVHMPLILLGMIIAAATEPVAEREGRVTIACESGAWAQELELMSDALRSRLDATVGENRITSLRFTADLSRHR